MTSKNEPVERRKHRRFQVYHGTYVAIGPPYDKVGPMIDISMGGLSFRYSHEKGCTNGSYANIFLTEANFHLEGVPVKTILDFEVTDESSSSCTRTRRCGLQFGDLTNDQQSQLEFFIQNYHTGET
jgi:hypothetical protein